MNNNLQSAYDHKNMKEEKKELRFLLI
jgi:hypothetical protein